MGSTGTSKRLPFAGKPKRPRKPKPEQKPELEPELAKDLKRLFPFHAPETLAAGGVLALARGVLGAAGSKYTEESLQRAVSTMVLALPLGKNSTHDEFRNIRANWTGVKELDTITVAFLHLLSWQQRTSMLCQRLLLRPPNSGEPEQISQLLLELAGAEVPEKDLFHE